MRPIASFLNGLLSLVLFAMLAVAGIATYVNHEFTREGPLTHGTTFVVPKGEGASETANRLHQQGLIRSAVVFKTAHLAQRMGAIWRKEGRIPDIKAGEYEIKRAASMQQIVATLIEGKTVLFKITLPEGLTSYQIVERLKADPNLTGEVTEVPPEGSLLPDTYRFSRGTSRADLLSRLRAERDKFIASAWERRAPDAPVKTPEEAIILASIVEKETGRADERERVAGVFANRLKKRMRLQSDPTIIYGIVGGKGTLGRGLLRSEIDKATPYNTYQIDGLPPGPICNPGRSAISAVLNPAKTEDLYFVADGTGGHAFAPTLKEHNANVAQWRKVEREIRAKQVAVAAGNASKTEGQEQQPGTAPVMVNGTARRVPAATAAKASEEGSVSLDGVTIPLPARKPKP